MNRPMMVIALMLLLVGCRNSGGASSTNKEKLLRKSLSDTNVALSEAQDRAARYQKGYERLVHEKVKQKRLARKKVK